MNTPHGCLLLDLDGTIRQTKSGEKFINTPNDQQLIEGAAAAAKDWAEAGWAIYGVTNQGGVLHGHKSFESMVKEQELTLDLMPQLEVIYACPDRGESCYVISRSAHSRVRTTGLNALWLGRFRKPKAGMLMAAIHSHVNKVNPEYQALMVGDRDEDKQAAEAASIPFLDAARWRSGYQPCASDPLPSAPDLTTWPKVEFKQATFPA